MPKLAVLSPFLAFAVAMTAPCVAQVSGKTPPAAPAGTNSVQHALTLAEDAWLAADFPLDPAALKALADQAVARLSREPKP